MIYGHDLRNEQKIAHLIHVTKDVIYNLQECEGEFWTDSNEMVICSDLVLF